MPDSTSDTLEHIALVQDRIREMQHALAARSLLHDQSKLEEPEKSILDAKLGVLAGLRYGTQEYTDALASVDMQPFLDHHYAANSHHPEHKRSATEEWRSIIGFEGYYEVNNFGDVRSIDRLILRDGTQGNMVRKGQARKPHVTPKGYLRIQLSKNGEYHNFQVHRLVAEAFISNPENKPEVNHRNGNKQDNHVDNLEWVTTSENQIHAYGNGLKQPSVKYVVTCNELDITTFGTEKMEHELRTRGYERASSAAIWNCITGNNHSHLDLTFSSCNIEEYRPASDIRFMSLIDVMEMLCDWVAAGMRVREGSIAESLVYNKARFAIDDQLYCILQNTVREMHW